MSDIAASFANAAAAVNSVSNSLAGNNQASHSSGTSGSGHNDNASSSNNGAANLLRHFGRFLSRGGSTSGPTSARALTLINQLQTANFDTEQLQCLQDLCDIINMNTEDALQEFPAKQTSAVLTELMSGAAGFEVAIAACRALTYMLDCVPHASKCITVDTVKCLIAKLNDIECIDIAEQALSALEFLSTSHHAKTLLRAGGIEACLQYIDFFSTLCQQKSLTVVANCCLGISPSDFSHIRNSLERLSQQLMNQDKKCSELAMLAFSYIISGCERDETIIRQIASQGFLLTAQQVLAQFPVVVGQAVLCQLFQALSTICHRCPDQAVQLLMQNFPSTLAFLLTGNRDTITFIPGEESELRLSSGTLPSGVCQAGQELVDIVQLLAELLPPTPDEELFSSLPIPPASSSASKTLSAASQYMTAFLQAPLDWSENPFQFLASGSGDNENEADNSTSSESNIVKHDTSSKNTVLFDLYTEKPHIFHGLVANLTGPLLDICQTTTAGTIELKAKCLETLQRLLLVAPVEVLEAMIKGADLSSCLSQFLAVSSSSDLRVAALALQICHILLQKCPVSFTKQAVKQGISHQIAQTLVYVNAKQQQNEEKNSTSNSKASSSRPSSEDNPDHSDRQRSNSRHKKVPGDSRVGRSSSKGSTSRIMDNSLSNGDEDFTGGNSSGFRKLRSTVKSVLNRNNKPSASHHGNESNGNSRHSGYSHRSNLSGRHSGTSPASNRHRRGGGGSYRSHHHAVLDNAQIATVSKYHSSLRAWIAKWAQLFLDSLSELMASQAKTIDKNSGFEKLKCSCKKLLEKNDLQALAEIRDLIMTENFSLFELGSSGLTDALIKFLGSANANQLRCFLRLYASLPPGLEITDDSMVKTTHSLDSFQRQPIAELVHKIVGCFQQVEQFEVKSAMVKDRTPVSLFSGGLMPSSLLAAAMTGSASGSNGAAAFSVSPIVRFFSTSSLKLELKNVKETSRLTAPSCLVRIDPLLTVDVLSRWIVQKGLHIHHQPLLGSNSYHRRSRQLQQDNSSMSGADDDFDEGDESIAEFSAEESVTEQTSPTANFNSSNNNNNNSNNNTTDNDVQASSTSQRSTIQIELKIKDQILPPEMTLYQAVAQYGQGLSDDSLFNLSSADVLFQQPHTINFQIRGSQLSNDESNSIGEPSTSSIIPSNLIKTRLKLEGRSASVDQPTLGLLDNYLRSKLDDIEGIEKGIANYLHLLRMLFGLNRYWYTLFDLTSSDNFISWFPSGPVKSILLIEEFLSPKINLKAQRQLRDTFVLATGIIPKWLQIVCSNWPFLLAYEVRQQIFYLSTFGRDRGILRLNQISNQPVATSQSGTQQNNGGQPQNSGSVIVNTSLSASDQAIQSWLSRIVRSVEKRRYEVSRTQLLADAMRVLKQSSSPGHRSSIVEIQYKNEVGVGLGPTLEFYALVSRHLQEPLLDLWHGFGDSNKPGHLLYPKSHMNSVTKSELTAGLGGTEEVFRFVGQFVARAIVDGRMVDLNLNPFFIDRLMTVNQVEANPLAIDLLWVDKVIAKSIASLLTLSRQGDSEEILNKRLDELMLDFEVPGRSDVDISGQNPDDEMAINSGNLEAYIHSLLDFFLSKGMQNTVDAFCEGFNTVFPIDALRRYFCSPLEIESFLCGSSDQTPWESQTLRDTIRPDHGYNQVCN